MTVNTTPRALPTHIGHTLRGIETQTVSVHATVSDDGRTVNIYDTTDSTGEGDYHGWECRDCNQPIGDEAVNAAEFDYI